MSEQNHRHDDTQDEHDAATGDQDKGGTATATKTKPRTRPARPRVDRLPPWRVLLHNDDVNEMEYVVETITMLTPLAAQDAVLRMLEAHQSGTALLMSTHRERAELVQEQFISRQLVVTIEPDDG